MKNRLISLALTLFVVLPVALAQNEQNNAASNSTNPRLSSVFDEEPSSSGTAFTTTPPSTSSSVSTTPSATISTSSTPTALTSGSSSGTQSSSSSDSLSTSTSSKLPQSASIGSAAPSSTSMSTPSTSRTSSATDSTSSFATTTTSTSATTEQSSSSRSTSSVSGSSTMIDVLVMTTYVVDGSSSIPTVLSRTIVKIGTVTGSSVAEVTAALNAVSQGNSDSGLSSENKRIIIGVVAGLGGFIILAALGTLLYRVMGKRSSSNDYGEAKTDSPTPTSYETDYSGSPKSRARVGEMSQNF